MERIDPAASPRMPSSPPSPATNLASAEVPSVAGARREAIARAVARWSLRFGAASTAELEARLVSALAAPDPRATPEPLGVDAERLCLELERAHEARFGRAALAAEWADDEARALAASSGPALARYQQKWDRTFARLQRAHPQRWRVAGLSDDEVRDALTLRLIELIVAPPADTPPGRPGKAFSRCVAEAHLALLRRSFRLGALPTDFAASPVLERAPSLEERCIELEADQRRTLAGERAQHQLSRPQRRWLAAMQHAAANGEFFASSDQLNLSAAARQLGKNRSSALRAYGALQACFQRELDGLD
jgi:hypothetical protein